MANIKHLLDDIRKNKYCVDMKETFCNALNEANANAEEIESNVKKIKDEIISINANAEIIDARCGEENLGNFNRKISSQLDANTNHILDIAVDITNYKDFVKNDDWSYALLEAMKYYSKIRFPKGTYKCSPVFIPSGYEIYGDGDNTKFIPLGDYLFRIEGKLKDNYNDTDLVLVKSCSYE